MFADHDQPPVVFKCEGGAHVFNHPCTHCQCGKHVVHPPPGIEVRGTVRLSESPTHPDAPRAGGETPDIAAILATVPAEDFALVEHLERCTHMHVTSTEYDQVNAWADRRNRARVLLLQRMASLLERHRDGERAEPAASPEPTVNSNDR